MLDTMSIGTGTSVLNVPLATVKSATGGPPRIKGLQMTLSLTKVLNLRHGLNCAFHARTTIN